MKNILFSLTLAMSLIVGSTFAFADAMNHKNDQGRGTVNAQELKKGLDEPIVIQNGEASWVVHQPQDHRPQYFTATSQGEMAGGSNRVTDSRQG